LEAFQAVVGKVRDASTGVKSDKDGRTVGSAYQFSKFALSQLAICQSVLRHAM